MANPPPWVVRTKRADGVGSFNQARGPVVAGVAAGVVTSADVNSQPSGGTPMSPSKWAYIWVGLAAFYLIGVYTGSITIGRER